MKQFMVGINPHHCVLLIVKLRSVDGVENVNETENSKPDIVVGLNNLMTIDEIKVIMNMLININGTNIKFIKNPTEEQCLIAIRSDANCIKYIEKPSKEMWILALTKDASTIKYFKDDYFGINNLFDILKTALSYSTDSSIAMDVITIANKRFCAVGGGYIHEPFKYNVLCRIAVDIDNNVFEIVNRPSEELCLSVIHGHPEFVKRIEHPSDEFCMKAIKKEPGVIRYIQQTYEMCLMAVRQEPYLITRCIYDEYLTEELCYEAIKICPWMSLTYIPKKSLRICIEVDEHCSYSDWISDLNEKEQTDEICEYFIKNCRSQYWCYRRKLIKNKSRKIKWMKLLKSLGFWKVK